MATDPKSAPIYVLAPLSAIQRTKKPPQRVTEAMVLEYTRNKGMLS